MPEALKTIHTLPALRRYVSALRKEQKTIALVPTMGALHDGHLSLVKRAQSKCDVVIVSIFVNPTQFGHGEDFETYPRDEKGDAEKLKSINTDLIYAPKAKDMYGEGFATQVCVTGLTDVLCGASRPGHFDGVALVVTKLLLQALPDLAVFGEKDYQQLLVIKRFVQDLNIPVKILGAPILREADGLALSSRNAYLSKTERHIAPKLQQTLLELKHKLYANESVKTQISAAKRKLKSYGFDVDYLEIRDAKTLEAYKTNVPQPSCIFVAARLGSTRLIDNIALRALHNK